jgi:hypothetical protein
MLGGMANADVISRMHRILDAFERGEILPTDVERAVQFHMEALEALPYERIKDADRLCCRLVTSHLTDGQDEFIDTECVADVLKDFRSFLSLLPGADAA